LKDLPTTQIIGSKIEEVPITSSTNTYAINFLTKNKPQEGTVIIASDQTEGRGQIGRKWYSSRGSSITLSVIIYPDFIEIHRQFILSVMVALGVYQTLIEFCDKKISIKWPNDLLIDHKKAGGILIQNNLHQKKIKSTVFGIGLNINNESFPQELPNATSLYLEQKVKVDQNKFLESLFKNLDHFYKRLKNKKYDECIQDYLTHLWGMHKKSSFSSDPLGKFNGTIRGITHAGKLKLEIDGKIKLFSVGEINFNLK
jgi:BirA family biotin operon repressor/biotin-[acetyl-CoA-carboxylase] ligase